MTRIFFVLGAVGAASAFRLLLADYDIVPYGMLVGPVIIMCAALYGWQCGVLSLVCSLPVTFLTTSESQIVTVLVTMIGYVGIGHYVYFHARKSRRALKERERENQLVIEELNHRIKNMITVIRVTVLQSLGRAEDIASGRKHIAAQLESLTLAYDLLLNDPRPTLQKLLQREAEARGFTDQLFVQGDTLFLSRQSAIAVALIFHEIMTNSMKYGAWRNDKGSIECHINTDDKLHIKWLEMGSNKIEAACKEGFGSFMIEKAIRAFGGKCSVTHHEYGYEYNFTFPKDALSPRKP